MIFKVLLANVILNMFLFYFCYFTEGNEGSKDQPCNGGLQETGQQFLLQLEKKEGASTGAEAVESA